MPRMLDGLGDLLQILGEVITDESLVGNARRG